MGRYLGPKNRIARRLGYNVFGRARNPLIHKPNPPGQHGARRKKKSDYGEQLEEQQKLRMEFGFLSRRKLVSLFREVRKKKGDVATLLLQSLECRLEIAVWRLKFAATASAARQLVSHRHVLVNGKVVDRASFRVRPGMVISLKSKRKEGKDVQESIEDGSRSVPVYYDFDQGNGEGRLLSLPEVDLIPVVSVNVPLVCEFLAHTT